MPESVPLTHESIKLSHPAEGEPIGRSRPSKKPRCLTTK